MVEVVVKKVVRPEELAAMRGNVVVAEVDGWPLLYEFYNYAGLDVAQRWKFYEEGPFARAYAKWLSRHLEWLADRGLLDRYLGPRGGKAYRITKDGIKVLCALGLL